MNGRPTLFNEEITEEICKKISTSGKGIKRLCRENPHWPCEDTIFEWLKVHKSFSERYAQAKRLQIEVIVDEIIDIADNSSEDYYKNKDGEMVLDNEHIQRARLRIDTRKWLAAKLAPKVYGELLKIEKDNSETEEELKKAKELVNKLMADLHGRTNGSSG